MEIVIPIIAAVVGVVAGAGGIFAYNKRNENGGKSKADDLVRKAKHEASEIVLSAKKKPQRLPRKIRRKKMTVVKSGVLQKSI